MPGEIVRRGIAVEQVSPRAWEPNGSVFHGLTVPISFGEGPGAEIKSWRTRGPGAEWQARFHAEDEARNGWWLYPNVAQAHDVNRILADLGIGADEDSRVVDVWNKIDLIGAEARPERFSLLRSGKQSQRAIVELSAVTGEGVEKLLTLAEEKLAGGIREIKVKLPLAKMAHFRIEYGSVTVVELQPEKSHAVELELLNFTPDGLGASDQRG